MCRSLNGCINCFAAEDRIIRMIYTEFYQSIPFLFYFLKICNIVFTFYGKLKVYRGFNRDYEQCFCSKILKR